MKKSIFTLLVALLFAFVAMNAYAERLQVWGSTTCQKRFLEPGAKAFKKATGIDLKVVGVGTGNGLIALIEGKTKVSAASEDLE
ncbi:MAG: phosphate ABC transporter substrate-binding protein, partial [Nitrospirae bacterium]